MGKPDQEGVWIYDEGQPPITVIRVYGEWKWRQIATDEWFDLYELKDHNWRPIWTIKEPLKHG